MTEWWNNFNVTEGSSKRLLIDAYHVVASTLRIQSTFPHEISFVFVVVWSGTVGCLRKGTVSLKLAVINADHVSSC